VPQNLLLAFKTLYIESTKESDRYKYQKNTTHSEKKRGNIKMPKSDIKTKIKDFFSGCRFFKERSFRFSFLDVLNVFSSETVEDIPLIVPEPLSTDVSKKDVIIVEDEIDNSFEKKRSYYEEYKLQLMRKRFNSDSREKEEEILTPWSYISKERFLKLK